jgi:hypothetical protein
VSASAQAVPAKKQGLYCFVLLRTENDDGPMQVGPFVITKGKSVRGPHALVPAPVLLVGVGAVVFDYNDSAARDGDVVQFSACEVWCEADFFPEHTY